ncbi:putative partitioning protein A [Yersinia ruckeri]|nr:putative partitioning protein A [Yersinia ruckeri]
MKKPAGTSIKYAMSLQNIIDIYHHRGVPKYRDRHDEGFTIFVGNLKGGVSKTVSSVSLAHGLRAHPHLLYEDLRILVIDLDPQSSATMFSKSLSFYWGCRYNLCSGNATECLPAKNFCLNLSFPLLCRALMLSLLLLKMHLLHRNGKNCVYRTFAWPEYLYRS